MQLSHYVYIMYTIRCFVKLYSFIEMKLQLSCIQTRCIFIYTNVQAERDSRIECMCRAAYTIITIIIIIILLEDVLCTQYKWRFAYEIDDLAWRPNS